MQNEKAVLDIIAQLRLEPHIEGGYFRRTYTSALSATQQNLQGQQRPYCSSIYYLLTRESPIGYLHRNRSDILHYYHGGGSLKYYLLEPNGQLNTHLLGERIEAGEAPQLLVKGSCWKATELVDGDYVLLSEMVTPGFDYNDMQLAKAGDLQQFPQHTGQLERFIKPAKKPR